MSVEIEKVATAIREFIELHTIEGDIRIYFNSKAWGMSYGHLCETINFINPKDYFEYANPETVAMSFEGEFYPVMNYTWTEREQMLLESFDELIESFGFYYEIGDAWNLSLYEL